MLACHRLWIRAGIRPAVNDEMIFSRTWQRWIGWGRSALRNKRSFCAYRSHGFYSRKTEKARSINKPVEACAVVSGLLAGLSRYGKKPLEKEAWSAFNWFLEITTCKIALYDRTTGGCRDGLHPDRANKNQGAESTLSFLMALLEMRKLEEADVTERHLTMSILAEKSLDKPVMNKYETLFHRHPSNPILTGKDLGRIPRKQRF